VMQHALGCFAVVPDAAMLCCSTSQAEGPQLEVQASMQHRWAPSEARAASANFNKSSSGISERPETMATLGPVEQPMVRRRSLYSQAISRQMQHSK
jgi:hypothetical protein